MTPKEYRIRWLRQQIQALRAQIAAGKDYTGELTSKAQVLYAELDRLTQ